jgi:nucleotide-binding universal stress UspA family protein
MRHNIIVPLTDPWQDPERVAESALPLARALDEQQAGEVLLLSVIDIPVAYGALSGAPGVAFDKGLAQWVRDCEDYLARVAATIPHSRVRTCVTIGEAAPEILACVRDEPNPLVVMASHGRTGPRRLFLGSVAFRVVHDAGCPVFVVHAPFPGTPDAVAEKPERVLVPLDGSTRSQQVIAAVLDVLGERQVALHLLHVVEPQAHLRVDLSGYLRAQRYQAGVYLGEVAKVVEERGIAVSYDVRQGTTDEEILAVAAEQEIDAIAMVTHGRAGLSRLLFGSVAERLTHEGHVPLLLVRPHDGHAGRVGAEG